MRFFLYLTIFVSGTYETWDVDRMAYISSMFNVKKFKTTYYHKLPFNSKDNPIRLLGGSVSVKKKKKQNLPLPSA
jgi:hypothetical protein